MCAPRVRAIHACECRDCVRDGVGQLDRSGGSVAPVHLGRSPEGDVWKIIITQNLQAFILLLCVSGRGGHLVPEPNQSRVA